MKFGSYSEPPPNTEELDLVVGGELQARGGGSSHFGDRPNIL